MATRRLWRRMAVLATMVFLGVLVASIAPRAQSQFQFPVCSAPPSPETDTWPVAATDSLPLTGSTLTFSGAALIANDTGASLTMSSVAATSSQGGTITGTDPYTYTPGPGFTGAAFFGAIIDTFSYEVRDAAGQATTGVVRVTSTGDTIPPAVSISSPLSGSSVSGSVLVTASAVDGGGVAGVRFLDGTTPIGTEVLAAPFQTSWDTTLAASGPHTLTAIARDLAGNSATSAPITVTVVNVVLAVVPNVVGMTQTAAQAAIVAASLTVGAVSTANSTTVPAGAVIAQSPGDGASVAQNTAVNLIVSVGPATVTVPDLVGQTQATAQGQINGAGLTIGAITTANSATVAAGSVISQSPAAGTSVAPNSVVAFVVSLGPASAAAAVDKMVFSQGAGTRTTPAFSTAAAGEVLVALASSDGPAATASQTLTISGAGLSWTRLQRANTRFGTAEIWTATASAVLTNVTVTSTQASAGVHQQLTVIAFTGITGIGASSVASAVTGAPSVSLVAQGANSLVYAVGNDWDRAVARTIPAGQTKVREFVDTAVGDTFWVQAAATAVPAAGTTVTLNATAPTNDQWNLAIVELLAGAAPANVTVPNVVGSAQAGAQSALTAAGLTAGAITSANSATVAAGSVISQSPAAGASVAPGSAVALVISLGPAPVNVTVPNIVGSTQAVAQAAIVGAGLTVGTVTSANSATVAPGSVISQSPAAGASVAQNSAVAMVISLGPSLGSPTAQATVSVDGTGARTTPLFSTTTAGEVLVAFAASDGPTTGANNQSLTISGAGLTWTRVQRAATSRGVSEIWTATAPAVLTNVAVTSTQSVTTVLGAPVNQTLTVVAFTGVSSVGASNIASAASGAPRVSLVTQGAGSAVYAVGNDFDRAIVRTIPAGQTKIHEFLAPTGDTFWVQSLSGSVGPGTTVTLNATAPTTDQWNLAIVELKQ
jgi:beta-lactam-binding protein with PASTA domain